MRENKRGAKGFWGCAKIRGCAKIKGSLYFLCKSLRWFYFMTTNEISILIHHFPEYFTKKYTVFLNYRAIGLYINIYLYHKAHLMGMKSPGRKLFHMGDSLASSCANHPNRV